MKQLLSMLAIAGVVMVGGCGGSDSGGGGGVGGICGSIAAKAETCFPGHAATAVAAELGPGGCVEPTGAAVYFANCEANCITAATCAELRANYCGGATPGLDACRAACPTTATCDGGTHTYPENWACDGGTPDCVDGADEAGCMDEPTWTCTGSAEQIPASWKCDGFDDCANGADDTIVACGSFTCADSSQILAYLECNGWDDCADGSDEHAQCPAALYCL
jgi:hypothetical protein